MKTSLFRLTEDEASLVQLYRTLPADVKAAMLSLMMLQSEEVLHQDGDEGNVAAFAAQFGR